MTKTIYIFRKYTSSKLSDLTNGESTTNYIIYFTDLLFAIKSAWNQIYTGVAGQGLNEIGPAFMTLTQL